MGHLKVNVQWALEDYLGTGDVTDGLVQIFTEYLRGDINQADLEYQSRLLAGLPVSEVETVLDVIEEYRAL